MPEIWTACTGLIILFLFWRQLLVFKMSRKINYAPLVLIIGLISSISLFVFSIDMGDLKSDIRFSLLPLLVSLLFYMVMYVMYQLKLNSDKAEKEEHERLLGILISNIKEYFGILNDKLCVIESMDEKTLDAVQMALKNELSVFTKLSSQQVMLSEKLEQMYIQEESALLNIQRFLEKDIPDLDTVVHRHIDILRISQQDHFNKLKEILNNMNDSIGAEKVEEAVKTVHERLEKMQEHYEKSASVITMEVRTGLQSTIQSMSKELYNAKQLSESLSLSTQEYELKLQELHRHTSQLLEKSDTIHESMEDTYQQSQKIRPIYASLNELISRLMDIYGEYKHAKKELHILASELGNAEERHFEIMDRKIDTLGEDIHKKIEASLYELKEHYHFADKEVTSTVKTLAAKAQLQKTYAEE